MEIHISYTQKWALPFPCSKTKSKISFSHGWAQAVITTRRYVLENVQSEDMFINGMGFLVSILYTHTVVGGVVKCTGVIYGVRTSLFLTSQRMPSRYGGVHEHLKLYKRNNYIYVNVIIYVYIRTHRWLYVVITTKHKNRRRDTKYPPLQTRLLGYNNV